MAALIQLQQNEDKTKIMRSKSYVLKNCPRPLSSEKNHHCLLHLKQEPSVLPRLRFPLKEPIYFICKTAFLKFRRIRTNHHYLKFDATKMFAVCLVPPALPPPH